MLKDFQRTRYDMRNPRIRQGGWGRRAAIALVLGLSMGALSACDSLLEVDLPHLLTDAAIENERSAELQVNSAIALFECSYSSFSNHMLGHEGVLESIAGAGGNLYRYEEASNAGVCDSAVNDSDWFSAMVSARGLLSNDPALFVGTAEGQGNGVYDRIQNEWELSANTEARLSAISALYVAATLAHMGEFLCEAAIDGSDLLTPPQLLDMAEEWITDRALVHIGNVSGGDFEMPNDIAESAQDMAIALRARVRWANGDLAGAAADASTIADGFTAYVTRETGETRRNKSFETARAVAYGGMLGVNNWWDPNLYRPNPATGQTWPRATDPVTGDLVLPHTGYIFLGIMPDGRALEAGNIPVRWAEEERDASENPVPLSNGAVADTRVPHVFKGTQGPEKREVPARYASQDDDEPLASWREMRLIEADYELSLGTAASRLNVIGIVNDLRDFHGLPEISGTYLATLTDGSNDQEEVRHMLLEERRRELFSHGGRFLSTKIQNTDVLWFPRNEGNTPFQGYQLGGGVRQLFLGDEYTQNPYFVDRGGLDARGTGCDDELPGAQQPFLQ